MLESLKTKILSEMNKAVKNLYNISPPQVSFEFPPDSAMGDISTAVAFSLAKELKKSPRTMAEEIAEALPKIKGVSEIQVAGAGYLNFFLDKKTAINDLNKFFEKSQKQKADLPAKAGYKKIIVEHTNINPNKAAHIGHLRNAVLGDTFVRILRASGANVEVQNLIDDLGLQVADVVNYFLHRAKMDFKKAGDIENFGDYCWDAYAKMQVFYQEEPSAEKLRKETLKAIEEGKKPHAEFSKMISKKISAEHIALMLSLNIRYDLLVWESDILKNKVWEKIFEKLKSSGKIKFETEGAHKGCWIVPLRESAEFEKLEEPDKILVRSDGTITYIAKDIAYQMWKFSLTDCEFSYEKFLDYPDGEALWRTASPNMSLRGSEATEAISCGDEDCHAPPCGVARNDKNNESREFGGGERVYNVIDVRQSYLQKILKESLKILGYEKEAENSVHFAYEMVALTPKTARELGFTLSDEDIGKPYIEMSGRKGIGVKASDLINALKEKATAEVAKRNPDFTPAEVEDAGKKIAVGALRYFMLKFTRNKVVAFDINEALDFEGDSGPYLQYSAVRVQNIFEKIAQAQGETADAIREKGRVAAKKNTEWRLDASAWNLFLSLSKLEDALLQARRSEEPSQLARYAFTLAQSWNAFYHANPILQEKDEALRNQRLALAYLFEKRILQTLDLLGIDIPRRM